MTSTLVTAKQAAVRIRRDLNTAARVADEHGGGLKFGEYRLVVPRGLRFTVRATRTGVNVEIGDGYGPSYVNDVTGGDRRSINADKHLTPIVQLVEEYEQMVWGKVLGKIEWGLIVIGSKFTGVTSHSTDDDERITDWKAGITD